MRFVEPFVPAALAASGVGTWDYDVVRGQCFCDAAMSHLYGLTIEEGRQGVPIARLAETLHPDDRRRGIEKRRLMSEKGGLFFNDYRVVPRPGVVRWVLARGCYEPDASGRIVRGRGIAVDVTDFKQDGFADGQAFFALAAGEVEEETAIDRAAGHVLSAREAIDDLGLLGKRSLRPLVDALLLEIGRHLARLRTRRNE